ncbi:penicillin-binding protein 1C [Alcanivorax sp. S6407]|uniref:penicillin-binding protein 1C n=1 Tax=Alcanivorax sp. S6407 TaxID=2926424 RepID=UPI001FF5D573|nr:penicillin-binding protein 1C [Alcanivorax sp. S6407]MCK0153817.1 penicillin-binding protein 1C [Alcanivorax sp. S6407]
MSFRRRSALVLLLIPVLVLLALVQVLPLPERLQTTPYATLMLDRHGRMLDARIAADQQWRFVPVARVPDKYRLALLEFEDKRFAWHPGIDPLAIGRAAWLNLNAGRVVSGGSTLTMQLARLLRDDPPRTLSEKAREAALALQLEWHFSKAEILTEYASRAPFGGNTVGLRAASWRYFQREPDALSWAEAALLAVLPNAPSWIHPGRNRERLRDKRDRLLVRLHDNGQLDDRDLQLALLEPLPAPPRPLPALAPHLMNTLEKAGNGKLLETTLDASLQQRVQDLARQHGERLAREGVHNLAVVVIDHQQQQTRAYVGNVTHGNPVEYGAAVDIAASPRSTGSILKPLLYGLMLDDGQILPQTLIPDLPTNYGGFSPENHDHGYRGAVPAHEALSQSLNIPAVRMLRAYGGGRFHSALQRMGMTTLFRPAEDYGLTLILGGAEGRLDEITAIYARLMAAASGGTPQPLASLIRSVPSSEAPLFMLSPGAAWLTQQALREVARPGTARQWRQFSSSQPIAWKTGTSYGLRDAWAVGSNGRYTVGVWAGNGNGEPAPSLGGAATAAPLMLDVFSLLGPAPWPEPPLSELKSVQVCADDGYLAGGQCATRDQLAPRQSHFQTVTPHHQRIHLDSNGQRVHSGCEPVANMQHRDWFVLPPAQAWFYRRHHPDYRPLPGWRKDCVAGALALQSEPPMALVYPHAGSAIYIPTELSGTLGRAVFRAVHQNPSATLYWHLDDTFLGETRHFHEKAITADPGWHTLTLVDNQGFRLRQRFKVLGR